MIRFYKRKEYQGDIKEYVRKKIFQVKQVFNWIPFHLLKPKVLTFIKNNELSAILHSLRL